MHARASWGSVRFPGLSLLLSAFGLVFSVLLFPKIAPVWLLQFIGTVSGVLYANTVHVLYTNSVHTLYHLAGKDLLLYWAGNRQWITGAVFAGGCIRDAVDAIDEERAFTEAEREAFEAFAAEVESMSVGSEPIPGAETALLTGKRRDTGAISDVRQQYQETVMSVPGYDDVYGEELTENVAAEFNAELATVIDDRIQFTPSLQELLVRQASNSALERERYLEALAVERRSVVNARSRLTEIEPVFERTDPVRLHHASFDELLGYEASLESATEECEKLLEDRQHEIHTNNRSVRGRSAGTFLQQYLYRSLETSFPVLSSALEGIRKIGDRRRTVVRSIARRY